MTRAKMGRPLKLTPEVTERIVNGITAGVPLAVASQAAGIADSTRMYWEKRGREEKKRIDEGEKPRPEEKLYLDFLEATTRARARAIVRFSTQISLQAEVDWRAAAFMLERRHPEYYSKQVIPPPPSDDPVVIEVVYQDVTPVDGADVSEEAQPSLK